MASHSEVSGDPRPSGAGSKNLLCQVITPEKTLFEKTVDFVALPLFDGELGVLPGRSPLLGRLGYGELRVRAAGAAESYFIDGGFAQVRDNTVTVLTSRAIPAAQIDAAQSAQRLEAELEKPAVGDEAEAEKTKAVARLRAMVRISKRD